MPIQNPGIFSATGKQKVMAMRRSKSDVRAGRPSSSNTTPRQRILSSSSSFPAPTGEGMLRSFTMSTSMSGTNPVSSLSASRSPASSESVPATFPDSPNSDGHLAFLIQNRFVDPCKAIIGDKNNRPDRTSTTWITGMSACSSAYLSYLDVIRQKNVKSSCTGARDAECRLIKRRSTEVWEWTCTVMVRNPGFLAACLCSEYRTEHLDYCVKTFNPPLNLKSRRYDRSASFGKPISNSEGGTPKPIYVPPR